MLVSAERLLLDPGSGKSLSHGALLIEDGHIAQVLSAATDEQPQHAQHDTFAGATVCPAFLDIHIHGAAGHDVMEGTPEAFRTVSGFLGARGVGAYYPTTVTAPVDTILRSLDSISQRILSSRPNTQEARPLGIHLEGPFISHGKRGVHPPEYIQKPSISLFNRFWDAARGSIRLLTIAPEEEGAEELIRHAASLGVRASLGHSNADQQSTLRGIAAGAQSATHTFNAMRALDHREPGILGTVLDTDSLFAELICDGIHVHPSLVRLFWKAKGGNRAILITDGMSATGMPDGEYMLGGFPVEVRAGRCLHQGHLAGSVLTLDQAIRNFIAYTGADLEDTIRLVTANPATLTGVDTNHGALSIGDAASFNVLAPDGRLVATYLNGARVI